MTRQSIRSESVMMMPKTSSNNKVVVIKNIVFFDNVNNVKGHQAHHRPITVVKLLKGLFRCCHIHNISIMCSLVKAEGFIMHTINSMFLINVNFTETLTLRTLKTILRQYFQYNDDCEQNIPNIWSIYYDILCKYVSRLV